jgi:hypothetical protein
MTFIANPYIAHIPRNSLISARRASMHQTLTFMFVLTGLTSCIPEDPQVSPDLTTKRELVIEAKTLGESSGEPTKHHYEVQFDERGFYQVEHIYEETQFGSSKETQMYFTVGKNHYLVSSHEFSSDNILPAEFDGQYEERLEELPFTID